MKQAETMVRFLSRTLILAAMIAVLGTCEGGFVEDTPKADAIGHKPGDMVTVKVRTGGGNSASRSMAPTSVEVFSNIYEVVFRKPGVGTNPDEYYRGVGKGSDGYVSVSVPIDEQNPYQVLLLAGYNQTLLAAGYRPITGTPKDDVYIKADQANIVSITVETFPLQWDTSASNAIVADSGTPTKSTNDFEFSAVITGYGTVAGAKHYEVKSRYINFAPVDTVTDPALKGGTAITPASDKFEVRFHVPKLDPLIKMDINTDATVSMLTIAGYNVGLVPRYTTDYFKPVTFVADATKVLEESTGDTDPDGTSAARYKITIPTTAPLSITFGNNPSDAINGGLPAKDVDGLLRFELTYYAFGTRASKGMGWTIRNGLDRTADDDDTTGTTGNGGIGGYFPVKIGKGSDPQPQDVIIFY